LDWNAYSLGGGDQMSRIGILAYGSLIDQPGDEIKNVEADRINVETTFEVEFARSSATRGGAPTLVPVSKGGAKVKAVVIVLKDSVTEQQAMDMLWRRETHKKAGSRERYRLPKVVTENKVLVKRESSYCGIDIVVFYTSIAANIDPLTPQKLATLAIESARSKKVKEGKDGISYLISAKKCGIDTPLIKRYENEILQRTNVKTLEGALAKLRA
jgi:cation transport regulator ChaC